MSPKSVIGICMFIGSMIGSYIPELWGAGLFSFSSLIFGAVGALLGVYLGYKLSI